MSARSGSGVGSCDAVLLPITEIGPVRALGGIDVSARLGSGGGGEGDVNQTVRIFTGHSLRTTAGKRLRCWQGLP